MITWYLIEGAGIIHLDTVPEDGDPTRARDVLWVGRDTAVGRGSGPQSDEARFLTGDFTRAGDLDPWEDAGPTGTGSHHAIRQLRPAVTPLSVSPRRSRTARARGR